MSQVNFAEFIALNPVGGLSPELLARVGEGAFDVNQLVDPSVRFDPTCRLGLIKHIGAGSVLRAQVEVYNGAEIGQDTWVGKRVVIGENTYLGDRTDVGANSYIAQSARIADIDAERLSLIERSGLDPRTLEKGAIIGPQVVLPSEVQLAPYAVVPTSDSILQLGPFGTRHRMVTVYGSDRRPLYSVGCQFGISLERLLERANKATDTTQASGADYLDNQHRLRDAGQQVQDAYMGSLPLVRALRRERHLAQDRMWHKRARSLAAMYD